MFYLFLKKKYCIEFDINNKFSWSCEFRCNGWGLHSVRWLNVSYCMIGLLMSPPPNLCDWFPPNQIPLLYHTNQTASSINYNSVIVFYFNTPISVPSTVQKRIKVWVKFQKSQLSFFFFFIYMEPFSLLVFDSNVMSCVPSSNGISKLSFWYIHFRKISHAYIHTLVCNNKRNITIQKKKKIVPTVQLQQTMQQHSRPVSCLPLSF